MIPIVKKGGFGLLFFFLFAGLWAQAPQGARSAAPLFKVPEAGEPAVRGLEQPWAGGLNACHFAAVDLDGDGKDDYICLDRVGGRIRCFDADWNLLRGAEPALPPLRSWVQTCDYNGDGLKDIFTFNGISGITVYRNEGGAPPRFTQMYDGLPAEMFSQNIPLYCTSEDYPVIADIDGDGDIDILNFWVPSSGDFLLFYRNYAQEELHRADTFLLKVADWSWGCFVEDEESNGIFLDSCSWRETAPELLSGNPPTPKHSGSTLFAFKNSQTQLFDLVLGDVGYPDLYYLQNGGTPQKARITKYDTFFPYTTPVRLYNFPVMSEIRYMDTLCYVYSPYQSNPFVAEGSESVWRYADRGDGVLYAPLVQKDFLQSRMIDAGSGAYPVLYDYNRDGLPDLVIGNYGQKKGVYYDYGDWKTEMVSTLRLYKNTGSLTEPAFEKVSDDYLGLSRYSLRALYPTFITESGEDYLVTGMEDGRLWLFKIEDGTALLQDDDFLQARVNGFSAPVFFDLNRDGAPDLIMGDKKGRLRYYENTGDFPHLVLRTDTLGGVNVIDRNFSNFGYSKPDFWRGEDGRVLLAVGSENGEVFLYDSIEDNLTGTFRFLGKAALENSVIKVGIYASPLLCDFNADGTPELIIGNQCGGVEYFEGSGWHAAEDTIATAIERHPSAGRVSIQVHPNPFKDLLHITVVEEGVCRITDLQGRPVMKGYLQAGENIINTERLPKGFYLLEFKNRIAVKLVK